MVVDDEGNLKKKIKDLGGNDKHHPKLNSTKNKDINQDNNAKT